MKNVVSILFALITLASIASAGPSSTRELTGSQIKNGSGVLSLPSENGIMLSNNNTTTVVNKSMSGASNTFTNIPYNALLLTNAILNADISSGAAVSRMKLATGTASHVLINDAGGTMSSEARLAVNRGGTGLGSFSIGDILYASGSAALTNLSAGTFGYVLTSNGAGVAPSWQASSGGGTGLNFISNSDAEGGTSGWATYADAAGTTPVDGTGGSPSATWTQYTGFYPLAGTYSFTFTKGATNRQGDGASYAFSTNIANTAKVQRIEFDYMVDSGTFVAGASGVDSDVEVYVYDVTNSQLIQPSTYKLFSNSSTIPSHFSGYFQTASNSTNYRLIFHVATTSASAYALRIDGISVGPSQYVYGTPITDWVSYSPTFTGMGSVASSTFYSRRVGDSLEVNGKVTIGTSTGTPGLITIGYAGANANVTVDTAKVYGNGLVGDASVSTAATTTMRWAVLAPAVNATNVIVSVQTSTVSASTASTNANTVFSGAGQTMLVNFKVPIVGWSSSVQMSDTADQRVVAMSTYATPTGTPQSSATIVNFGVATVDTHGAWNGSTTYTVPIAGTYEVTAAVSNLGTAAASKSCQLELRKNASAFAIHAPLSDASSSRCTSAATGIVNAVAGDTLTVYFFTNFASPTFQSGVGNIAIKRLAGSSAIGATETVAFTAYRTTNQTSVNPNNSNVKVSIDTVSLDTHGAFSTGSTRYNVPIAGVYKCVGNVNVASTNTLANRYGLYLYKNGSAIYASSRLLAAGSGSNSFFLGSDFPPLKVVAGDYLELYFFGEGNNSASTLTINGDSSATYFGCHRIGM